MRLLHSEVVSDAERRAEAVAATDRRQVANMVELIVVDDEEEAPATNSVPPSHDRRVGDEIRNRMVRPNIERNWIFISYHHVWRVEADSHRYWSQRVCQLFSGYSTNSLSTSGVGYGICQRLLVQLSSQNPSDSRTYDFEEKVPAEKDDLPQRYTGLTLIMACRSVSRAQKAREELLRWFDARVLKAKSQPGYDGHAESFQENVVVEVEYVDLASIKTVFQFGERMSEKCVPISFTRSLT